MVWYVLLGRGLRKKSPESVALEPSPFISKATPKQAVPQALSPINPTPSPGRAALALTHTHNVSGFHGGLRKLVAA